jgi:hypothetical protein
LKLFPVVVLLALATACARHLPPQQPARALYRDLERMVALAETEGWDIDRLEISELMSPALRSACEVPLARREELVAWLDARIVELGGPVEAAFKRTGDLDDLGELVTLSRIRALLGATLENAAADCPFWLAPDEGFRSRQVLDDKWAMTLEGGGKAIYSNRDGQSNVTAGGAGRLLVGYTFGARVGLHAGVEVAASADFPRDATGERGGLVFAFDVSAPVVLRYHLVNAYLELEAAYLAHFTEEDIDLESGARVGLAIGGRLLRRRWFLPGAALALSYERTFSDQPLHQLKLGLRVSIDLPF